MDSHALWMWFIENVLLNHKYMGKLVYFSLFITLAVVTGCTGTAATGGDDNAFILTGNAEGMDGEYLYLYYESDKGQVKDTALVADGQFIFAGNLAYSMTNAVLLTQTRENPSNASRSCRLYLEAEEMTIYLKKDDFINARLDGSRTQEEADSLFKPFRSLLEEAKKLQDGELRTEKNPEILAKYQKRVEEIHQKYAETINLFIETHPDSYITVEQIASRSSSMSFEELEKAYSQLSPKLKASKAGCDMKKELDALKAITPGQIAPDFTTTDINDKTFSLSDLRGKVVLLDFWSSSCAPCRKSNPHLLELYKKYHDKGLEILCVGDNDNYKSSWKKAIEDDGIQAFHHVLRGLKRTPDGFDHSTDISIKYAVRYLPTKFLIDQEGKIIGKMKDAELNAKLKEIFGE